MKKTNENEMIKITATIPRYIYEFIIKYDDKKRMSIAIQNMTKTFINEAWNLKLQYLYELIEEIEEEQKPLEKINNSIQEINQDINSLNKMINDINEIKEPMYCKLKEYREKVEKLNKLYNNMQGSMIRCKHI